MHFLTEKQLLDGKHQKELARYIWDRFEVRLFYVDMPKKKVGTNYPVEWIHYRLHEAGYLDATGRFHIQEIEDVIPLKDGTAKIARTKVFRTNLRVQPIDLISWIVAGCPPNPN